jgi:pyruvate/2-oxoglutarate/acetoin dehydrogenase E1 component
MKYLELINQKIKDSVVDSENLVLFGQNIDAGSCLGGLTRGMKVPKNSRIINSTNTENSLCGFGFGMMINEVSSVFFMKQLDFLLLGIDHLVNTYNIIRNNYENLKSSFTIMPVIVDNGYQGPQSSHNNFGDFCSIARIQGYTVTNKLDIEKIISTKLISPGFRIIGVSQRLMKTDLIEPENIVFVNKNSTLFQYSEGEDATIVCFNFSFPQGWKLMKYFKKENISASLFNVNSPTPIEWDKILENVTRTKKIIVIDDSKSANLNCDSLLSEMVGKIEITKKIIFKRNIDEDWLNPIDEEIKIDESETLKVLRS